MKPFSTRGWTARPELTSLEEMGVTYNSEMQRNEFKGSAIAELPQFIRASDHTSSSQHDDDDYSSDI